MGQSGNHMWLLAASYLSVVVAITLIVVKGMAWIHTGSASLLASLVDSLMDSFASIINMFAIRLSLKPADSDHRFGHGKAEALSALAQAGFILGSAVFLFLYCLERLFDTTPHVVDNDLVGIIVMVFSTIITAGLLVVQRIAIKKTGSTALAADSLHYAADMAVNISVIVALVFVFYGINSLDLYLGFAISVYIAYGAIQVGRDALDILMDKVLPDEVVDNIVRLTLMHPDVEGVHEIKTRQSGITYVIQMHIEMDGDMNLSDAHAVAEQVEQTILNEYPGSDVIIHQDPLCSVDESEQSFPDRVTKDDLLVDSNDKKTQN